MSVLGLVLAIQRGNKSIGFTQGTTHGRSAPSPVFSSTHFFEYPSGFSFNYTRSSIMPGPEPRYTHARLPESSNSVLLSESTLDSARQSPIYLPSEILQSLDSELPDFVLSVADSYHSPKLALLAYMQHLATGGRDQRPVRPLLPFDYPEITKAQLLLHISGHHYQAELHRDSAKYKFFPASVVCCNAHLRNFSKQEWEPLSQLFALHLSDADHEDVLGDCGVKDVNTLNAPEAFGYLRYLTDSRGAVRVVEINNEIYDRLSSDELKERYRDWQCELLDAFIEYVGSAEDIATQIIKEREGEFNSHPTRTIVIPPPSIMFYQLNEVDLSLVVERYMHCPERCGFKFVSTPKDFEGVTELPVFSDGLYIEVASPPEGRRNSDNPRIRIAELLEIYCKLEDLPPPAIPIPPLSLPIDRINASTLHPSVEIVPATPISFSDCLSLSLACEFAQYHEFTAPYRCIIDAIIGEQFTVMSRGFNGGMHDDWAISPDDIPDQSLEPGVYLYPVQSGLQNRHPSIRFLHVDELGNRLFFRLAIKGAGVAEKGDNSVIELPEGLRVPIYKTTGARIVSHNWWGGLPYSEAITEASNSIALFSHIAQFHPELEHRAPFPIRISVPTMWPVWRENCGEEIVDWLSSEQYFELITGSEGRVIREKQNGQISAEPDQIGDEKRIDSESLEQLHCDLPFATLMTITPSDVRLLTIVDRIFEGFSRCAPDIDSRLKDINRVMRFFYREHGYTLQETEEPITLAQESLSIPVILDYLRQLSELNSEVPGDIYHQLHHDTLSIIRSVHRRGGHFGGGRFTVEENKDLGIGWGGATAIRNMDIKGGFHDLAAGCCFPWFRGPNECDDKIKDRDAETLKKFDLIYFAETAQWLRLILFGLKYDPDAITKKVEINPHNDICIYSADSAYTRIINAAENFIFSDMSATALDQFLFGESE